MPSANDPPYFSPILLEVQEERVRQVHKWGLSLDDKNGFSDWHEVIADYNGWARRMFCMGSADKGRRRLVQLASLAVAQIETLDRQQLNQKEQS
jgi:hypothetical protein